MLGNFPQAQPRTQRPAPTLPQWQKDLRDIPADKRFDSLRESTFSYVDKDGKPVTVTTIPGTVTAVDPTNSSITINKNSGGSVSYKTDGNTVIRGARALGDIKSGDKVLITVVNNSGTAAAINRVNGGAGGAGFAPFGGGIGGPKGGFQFGPRGGR
jgi:hypothetical protein